MAQGETYSDIQRWNHQLNSVGRAEFKTSFQRFSWWYLVLAFGFMNVLMAIGYLDGRFTAVQAMVSTTFILGSILAILVWQRVKHSGTVVIVEQDSIHLMDGSRFFWNEIVNVVLHASSKSGTGFVFEVTQPAWDRYLKNRGLWSRLNHRLNKAVLRKRAVYMAAYLGVDGAEFREWLNSYAEGKREKVGE